MESKHTKGEWSVNSNSELYWIETNDESESKIICTISNNDKCESNAKLIANASELLEVLVRVDSFMGKLIPVLEKKGILIGENLVTDIKKTIEKATK